MHAFCRTGFPDAEEEALPLGNGRWGVMVYGGSGREELQLNEETIWAGGPHNNVSPEALAALPEVRRLIFGGKYDEAFELCDEKFSLHASHGMPYQTAGSLLLDFPGHQACSKFYRDLNLETAVALCRGRRALRAGDVHLLPRSGGRSPPDRFRAAADFVSDFVRYAYG